MAKKTNNQISAQWAIMCTSASVDQHTNQLSLFNIIEDVAFNMGPAADNLLKLSPIDLKEKVSIKYNFTLVVQLNNPDPAEILKLDYFINIKTIDPAGSIIADINELQLKFEKGKARMRTIISFDTMMVTKSGKYDYVVSTRDSSSKELKEVARAPVEIKIYN